VLLWIEQATRGVLAEGCTAPKSDEQALWVDMTLVFRRLNGRAVDAPQIPSWI
jgi:hypothetical protein